MKARGDGEDIGIDEPLQLPDIDTAAEFQTDQQETPIQRGNSTHPHHGAGSAYRRRSALAFFQSRGVLTFGSTNMRGGFGHGQNAES